MDEVANDYVSHEKEAILLGSSQPSKFPLNRHLPLSDDSAATTEGFSTGVVYTERYADGSVYVGTFGKDGRDGAGKLTYSNGDVYEGQFSKDARHAHGRLVYANGDVYEGNFDRDEQGGHGCFQCHDGWRYEGEFRESMIHGTGRLAFSRTDFPSELLATDLLCGPLKPAVVASRIPGSIGQLLDVTRTWGCYNGQFREGLRHGTGRVEFVATAESTSEAAQSSNACMEPHFIEAEWCEGERHGHGTVHIDGYVHYEGDFCEDEASGHGKLTRWFQGGEQDTFEGEFYRGAVHGRGQYYGPDTTVYSGQFCEGLRDGEGQLEVRGTSYNGQFAKGRRHGVGRYRSNKVSYSGHYLEDQRHGDGLLKEKSSNGHETIYEGEFIASMRHGQGQFKNHECNYTGAWQNNARHGFGKQSWHLTGESYEGQWQGDKMHGHGTLLTPTVKYVGQFSKGEMEGEGLQVWWKDTGNSFEGRFHGNRPHGFGTYSLDSGESYVGHMANGVFSGEGSYTYSNGNVYEGNWHGGKQNGHGRLTYADGCIYQGQFHHNQFHGKGAFIDEHESIFAGSFDLDRRCGEISVMHDDGQRETRRYDSDGHELERKNLPRVLSNRANKLSVDAKLASLSMANPTKGSNRIMLPELPSLNQTPRVPSLSARSADASKCKILSAVTVRYG